MEGLKYFYYWQAKFTNSGHIADREDQQEQIQLWLHNHITTAATFLQFSLVAAIIADGDNSSSILL